MAASREYLEGEVTVMRIRVGELKKLIREALDDEMNTLEVGDVVDVDLDEIGTLSVRVIELVDNVNDAAGEPDPRAPGKFTGPGFVGEIEAGQGESGTMVFSLNDVVPGSKAKGYFPKLGDEFDEDEWGRPVSNPYRKMASRV